MSVFKLCSRYIGNASCAKSPPETTRERVILKKVPQKQRAKGCFGKKPPKNNARKGDFEKSPRETTRERVFWKKVPQKQCAKGCFGKKSPKNNARKGVLEKVSQKQRAKGHFVFKTMQNVR